MDSGKPTRKERRSSVQYGSDLNSITLRERHNSNLKAIEKTSSNQQQYIKESPNFKGDYND